MKKPIYPYKELGQYIRDLRENKAVLSQEQVARRAGLSRNIVAMIERGESDPKISTLRRIFRAVGYEVDLHWGPK